MISTIAPNLMRVANYDLANYDLAIDDLRVTIDDSPQQKTNPRLNPSSSE